MKPRERRYLNRLLGESAQGRGRVSEESLLEAVRKVGVEYEWFLFARKATTEEDERGIDIAVHARGVEEPLYMQSKSSIGKAKSFATKRREDHIEVVVVSLDNGRTETRTRKALERAYAKATGLRGVDVGTQAEGGA